MNSHWFYKTITALALTAIMTVGVESSSAQNRFKGMSFSGKSLSGNSAGRGKSLSSHASSARMTTKPSLQNAGRQNVFDGQHSTFGNLSQIRGNPTKKTAPDFDPRRGHLNGGTAKTGNGKIQFGSGGSKSIATTRLSGGKPKIELNGGIVRGKIADHLGGKLTQNDSRSENRIGPVEGHHRGKILDLIKHNQAHDKVFVDHHRWCHSHPKHCHWWYDWCKPIRYCEPVHHVTCAWDYVRCDYVVGGQVVVADARWYLGLKGLLLPGQGVGIEEVAPGSPAADVGLESGMVITRCNGIDLVDENALAEVISRSGGVLQMELLLSSNGPPATCVVVMLRVTSLSY